VNDNNYRDLLDTNIKSWLEEFKEVVDKRVLLDLLKYKIRQFTINYSKTKARNRRAKVNELEEKLQNCTKKCEKGPCRQNVEDLKCLQAEYDQFYDYITQGAIVCSRATWYEKGEKNNKYFLNLEKSNKEKSCLHKILKSDGTIVVNPKSIMSELESFYTNLYKESNCLPSSFLDDLKEVPTFNVLQSFQKNKTPGNDGLTIEFYVAFWSSIGRPLVDCVNYSYCDNKFFGSLDYFCNISVALSTLGEHTLAAEVQDLLQEYYHRRQTRTGRFGSNIQFNPTNVTKEYFTKHFFL